MAFSLITDREEIEKYDGRLSQELKAHSSQQFECFYSTRGLPDGRIAEGWYFKDYDIYWRPKHALSKHKRHINFFGQGKPTTRFKDAFQLNMPLYGVNRRIKGAFLKSG